MTNFEAIGKVRALFSKKPENKKILLNSYLINNFEVENLHVFSEAYFSVEKLNKKQKYNYFGLKGLQKVNQIWFRCICNWQKASLHLL